MRGRGVGRGSLRRIKVAGGWAYRGEWQDAQGKRRRRILGGDKRTAERVLAEVIRQRDLELGGLAGEEKGNIPFRELLGTFLRDLALRTGASHVDKSRRGIGRILDRVSACRVQDLRASHATDYLLARVGHGASNSTANLDLTYFRSMLNWAVRNGLVASNPLQGIRKLPEGRAYRRNRKRALDEDEAAALLRAARDRET